MASSLGLALAAADRYGRSAPRVHIIEGEGGLTPGRVSEALAFAGTASLDNVIVHLDWNQSSIDSDRVCREDGIPGDYVQWTPAELFYLHDWNVVEVPDGTDLAQIRAAQRLALELENGQPTAIVYRTTKGWRYGIEGTEIPRRRSQAVLGVLLRGAVPAAGVGLGGGPDDFLSAVAMDVPAGVPRCEPGESVCHLGGDAPRWSGATGPRSSTCAARCPRIRS